MGVGLSGWISQDKALQALSQGDVWGGFPKIGDPNVVP